VNRSPIQQHTSALIKGLIAESKALKTFDQTTVKGRLIELFTSRLLSRFLTSQFGVGSGVIINQIGKRSSQIDIIIYDTRILPPFIEEQNIGVYPIEAVLAAIEVRSRVDKSTIKKYAKKVAKLYEEVYDPTCSWYYDYQEYLPFYCLVGFNENGLFKKQDFNQIRDWMANNVKPLFGVCIINNLSWLHVCTEKGGLHLVDENNEETKAFVAILLDNIRTVSQRRYLHLTRHIDWLGIYARDQTGIKNEFEKREAERQAQGNKVTK
jgi:hypothetical protein